MPDSPIPAAVLEAWCPTGATVAPLGSGLINETWLARPADGEPLVLQAVNPLFPVVVNEDIRRLTRHLRSQGLLTPELVATGAGDWWLECGGTVWRALNYIDGEAVDAISSADQAAEAGRMLARFHLAAADFSEQFRNQRPGVHDTPRHLANLRAALDSHASHPRYDVIRPLAEIILGLGAQLPSLGEPADRVVHGDPKISNFLFSRADGAGLCMVDLDTITRMPVALELGDAMRSWCNPGREDDSFAEFSVPYLRAAVGGYAEAAPGFLQPAEWQAIVPATHTILVELAARFCADALKEEYFGWDRQRFATRGEHNEVRARNQLTMLNALLAVSDDAERAVREVFA